MQALRQNTAASILVGPVLDASGAAVTTAVVGDFNITKNGTSAALASPATASHSHNGYYVISLATGNVDTLGRLVVSVNNALMSMSTHRYMVQDPTVFDALFSQAFDSAGGLGDLKRIAGQALTAAAPISFPASVANETTVASRSSQTSVDGKPTLTQIEASTVLAKESTVSGRPTLTQIEASTILAKEATVSSRASQTSVDSKPTLTQIEASTVLAKEATVAARATQTSVDAKPSLTQIEASTILAKEATVSSRASQTSVDGKPTLTQIESSTVLAKEATVGTRATQTSVDGKPTLTQIESSTILAKENTVVAVGNLAGSTLTGVNTLLSRVTSGVGSMFLDLIAMITGSGTANAKWSANALSLAPTGGGGGQGTGARTVTITVNLSAAPVEGAKVRMTKAGESYLGTTNSSGQTTFNIDDGSWIVGITSPGTTFAGAVLAVTDNQAQSYSLTAQTITPSAPGGVTGYWTCLSQLGLPESGVTMSMRAVSLEHGSTGLALDTTVRTTTSDANGLAQFADLIPGVRYQAWRGSGARVYVTIPSDADSTLELNSLLGTP